MLSRNGGQNQNHLDELLKNNFIDTKLLVALL